ncbi:MAG: type I-G CRISPR-associated protein Csb2, partial [Acidimicrobiales bacterium]
MLAISVELLHGTLRAASADDTALSGDASGTGEWPPSPARLFAALVAADGTRDRCRVTDGAELLSLEQAKPPRILASPEEDVLRSRLQRRYVVVDKTDSGAVQEYPGRTSMPVRPGERVAPRSPRVVYLWDELAPPPPQLQALTARAARVGYLGCADSPARVRVLTDEPIGKSGLVPWVPDEGGSTRVPVPFAGLVDELDHGFDRWEGGEQVRRAWLLSHRARYRSPSQAPARPPRPVVLWLQLDPAVPGRKALAVAETLKEAVLDLYAREVGGGDCPAVLHGHGFSGPGYQHAHWLVLPDVGHPHAKGRLHGAAVWLPPDTDAKVMEGLREVLWRLGRLVRPGWFDTRVRLYQGDPRPVAALPCRWEGPARRWVSALPVVQERWLGTDPD